MTGEVNDATMMREKRALVVGMWRRVKYARAPVLEGCFNDCTLRRLSGARVY
jgi:hypothetical protein